MEAGALGWKFQDEIQSILDDYDWQSDAIRRNGTEGRLARMRAVDDARANSGGNRGKVLDVPYRVVGQPDQVSFALAEDISHPDATKSRWRKLAGLFVMRIIVPMPGRLQLRGKEIPGIRFWKRACW